MIIFFVSGSIRRQAFGDYLDYGHHSHTYVQIEDRIGCAVTPQHRLTFCIFRSIFQVSEKQCRIGHCSNTKHWLERINYNVNESAPIRVRWLKWSVAFLEYGQRLFACRARVYVAGAKATCNVRYCYCGRAGSKMDFYVSIVALSPFVVVEQCDRCVEW